MQQSLNMILPLASSNQLYVLHISFFTLPDPDASEIVFVCYLQGLKARQNEPNSTEGEEVVFIKDNVAVHPTQNAQQRINGRLCILKYRSSVSLVCNPFVHKNVVRSTYHLLEWCLYPCSLDLF